MPDPSLVGRDQDLNISSRSNCEQHGTSLLLEKIISRQEGN